MDLDLLLWLMILGDVMTGSGVTMRPSQSFVFIIFVATLGIKITTSLY